MDVYMEGGDGGEGRGVKGEWSQVITLLRMYEEEQLITIIKNLRADFTATETAQTIFTSLLETVKPLFLGGFDR